jgi:hypothetical protein
MLNYLNSHLVAPMSVSLHKTKSEYNCNKFRVYRVITEILKQTYIQNWNCYNLYILVPVYLCPSWVYLPILIVTDAILTNTDWHHCSNFLRLLCKNINCFVKN